MTAQEAIAYLENQGWSKTRLGLERTRTLLAALGDPQKKLKFVHVAGSNGKGSTCAMLDSVLRCAGYRVGLYTSPHIQDFCERLRVNGANIPGSVLAEITERVKAVADAMEDHPSQFELVTAVAMVWFWEERCDIVVLEVGMGGALDSTNAIDAPEVAVITNIGLEHTEYLGNTLEEIARTKAGIIKPGCAVVCYDGPIEAVQTVRKVCREKDVPLTVVNFGEIQPLARSWEGQCFRWRGAELSLSLLGAHQLCNAATALETVEALRARGWSIRGDAVREGLSQVRWPARFEVLQRDPLFILDGGHNPQCARALAELLDDYLPGEKVIFLLGVLADKDYRGIVDILAPHAGGFVCIAPDSPRALPALSLSAEIERRTGLTAAACESVENGIRVCLGQGLPVVAFGSLYLAGHIRSAFPAILKGIQRSACLERRRALTAEQRAEYSRAICERLTQSPAVQAARVIFSYMASYDEVDLTEFHAWAAAHGKILAFPVCHADGRMDAAVPDGPDCWEAGRFSIRSPVARLSTVLEPARIDLILVPCVGFDSHGGRLGRGGGYYDRFLPLCPQAAKILVGFRVQRVAEVASGPHDAAVSAVLDEMGTESGFL